MAKTEWERNTIFTRKHHVRTTNNPLSSPRPEAEFMNVQFRIEVSGIILRVHRLKFTIANQLQTIFARGGGGGEGVKNVSIGYC